MKVISSVTLCYYLSLCMRRMRENKSKKKKYIVRDKSVTVRKDDSVSMLAG